MSAHIIAGNEYLASYARRHNRRVTILPTVVDTELFAGADHLPDAVRASIPQSARS